MFLPSFDTNIIPYETKPYEKFIKFNKFENALIIWNKTYRKGNFTGHIDTVFTCSIIISRIIECLIDLP